MKLNLGKCEYIQIGEQEKAEPKFPNAQQVKNLTEAKYQGAVIHNTGDAARELNKMRGDCMVVLNS